MDLKARRGHMETHVWWVEVQAGGAESLDSMVAGTSGRRG